MDIFDAVETGNNQTVAACIAADPNCVSKTGDQNQTPLHLAAEKGYDEIVITLLAASAQIEAQDKYKRTPLMIAAGHGHTKVVQVLVKDATTPLTLNICDCCNLSTLHISVQNRHLEVVKVLLSKDAPIDAQDQKGETPLFLAARNNDIRIVNELLAKGASTTTGNKEGKTVIDLANDGKFSPAVKAAITGTPAPDPTDDDDDDDDDAPMLTLLVEHVTEYNLQEFFKPDPTLRDSLRRYKAQALTLIEELKGQKFEAAAYLALLTLYDLAILIDDSGSMSENGGAGRKTLKKYLDVITYIYSFASEYKQGKVRSIRFLNSRKEGNNISHADANELLRGHSFLGRTKIGTHLKGKILDPLVNQNMKRPLLVMVITDGGIEGEAKGVLEAAITECLDRARSLPGGEYSVAFQFSRIGADSGAIALLDGLDKNAAFGKHVDCQSGDFNIESVLTGLDGAEFDQVTKLLVGAISNEWDTTPTSS